MLTYLYIPTFFKGQGILCLATGDVLGRGRVGRVRNSATFPCNWHFSSLEEKGQPGKRATRSATTATTTTSCRPGTPYCLRRTRAPHQQMERFFFPSLPLRLQRAGRPQPRPTVTKNMTIYSPFLKMHSI